MWWCSLCRAYHAFTHECPHALREAEVEKEPLATGVVDYFPDALAAVAGCSRISTKQHHPDTPMHWDRDKSFNHADSLMRHLVNRGSLDTDGIRHSAKVAWRALALLQLELEGEAG